jgi:hypothetical protein
MTKGFFHRNMELPVVKGEACCAVLNLKGRHL